MRSLGIRGRAVAAWWKELPRPWRAGIGLLVVGAGLCGLLLPVALRRLIDGDEGYLLMAARLASEGKLPYRDFFLPQGPMLPAVFGGFFWVAGRSWLGARVLAGIVAVAMGLLVHQTTLLITRRSLAAAFATAVFALSSMTMGWLTIPKTYGLSLLWMLVALWSVERATRYGGEHREARYGLLLATIAGLFMGLAASTRLYILLVVPVFAAYVAVRHGPTRLMLRRLSAYALGCAIGLLPLLVSYVLAREVFIFDTVLFHGIGAYGEQDLLGTPGEKLLVLLKALGLHPEASREQRQLMGMVITATLAWLAWLRWRGGLRSVAGWTWPVLLAASLLPNPFLSQYLCMLVPFLAVEGGVLLARLLDRCRASSSSFCSRGVLVGALAWLLYQGAVGGMERHRYVHSGVGVPGIVSGERAAMWQVATVEAVARRIDALNIGEGASWWPGYFVSTRTRVPVEIANDFGFRAAETMTIEQRRRFHLAGLSEVGGMIRKRRPRLFVEGNWAAQPWAGWLPANGYRLRGQVENARLWVAE